MILLLPLSISLVSLLRATRAALRDVNSQLILTGPLAHAGPLFLASPDVFPPPSSELRGSSPE